MSVRVTEPVHIQIGKMVNDELLSALIEPLAPLENRSFNEQVLREVLYRIFEKVRYLP